MLKCPNCGRSGGPFRFRHQIQADNQPLRAWACPCGSSFHATADAERSPTVQPAYTGFLIDWNDRPQAVRLQRIGRHETVWNIGPWVVSVAGPPSGPGTRVVTLLDEKEAPVGEWRLEPAWGAGEVTRRLKSAPLPPGLQPEFLGRLFVRILN